MKATLLLLFLSVLGPMAAARAVTFNLAGDWLADEEGIQGIPNGSLILLIASTLDTKFSPPLDRGIIDPRSDERLLGAFAASDDGNRSNRGCFAKTIQVNLGDKSQGLEHFGGGDPVMVRWFPTLSLEDLDALPNESIPYGEFRADEVLLGSNATVRWLRRDSPRTGLSSACSRRSLTVSSRSRLWRTVRWPLRGLCVKAPILWVNCSRAAI
jgi:hypothetical protein